MGMNLLRSLHSRSAGACGEGAPHWAYSVTSRVEDCGIRRVVGCSVDMLHPDGAVISCEGTSR